MQAQSSESFAIHDPNQFNVPTHRTSITRMAADCLKLLQTDNKHRPMFWFLQPE